jgi:hypothetical protein
MLTRFLVNKRYNLFALAVKKYFFMWHGKNRKNDTMSFIITQNKMWLLRTKTSLHVGAELKRTNALILS